MTRLLNRFSVLIFVSVTVLALVMGIVLSTLLTRTLSAWEAQSVAAFIQHHVHMTELHELFLAPRDADTRDKWAEAVPDIVGNLPGVVQCRIWGRDGEVVWSENAAMIGQRAPANARLQAALKGEVGGDLRELAPSERAQEFATLIDVYVPIRAKDDVLGVIQIYKRPTQLLSSLRWSLAAIWAVALLGGVALYAVVIALVRHTGRRPRPAERIAEDIQGRFGFVPPFFEPALATPAVLENLWQQTLAAYVDNPLPALFKERLFAYLSRFCAVPYCIVCHSCALRPLGMSAGDVLALLESPPPSDEDVTGALAVLLDQRAAIAAWPTAGSALDRALATCAVHMFLRPDEADSCQAEVRRVLGPEPYTHLAAFLGYVKVCLLWVETHPELAWEADERARQNLTPLLDAEPRLGEFFRVYPERVKRERLLDWGPRHGPQTPNARSVPGNP
ncbi:MAG: hypothetical protein HYU41_02050 [Candidatus Rokubacteria bacterium]|nr:hypothetical protein [Candidatus Rokubacteria bacterium]